MGKLTKAGLKERKKIFFSGKNKIVPKNKGELSIINAFSEVVAEHKKRRK